MISIIILRRLQRQSEIARGDELSGGRAWGRAAGLGGGAFLSFFLFLIFI